MQNDNNGKNPKNEQFVQELHPETLAKGERVKQFQNQTNNDVTIVREAQNNMAILANQAGADPAQWLTAIEQSASQNPALFDRLLPDAKITNVTSGQENIIDVENNPVVKMPVASNKIIKVVREGNNYLLTMEDGTILNLQNLVGVSLKQAPVILTEDGKVIFADELILALNNVANLGPLAEVNEAQLKNENLAAAKQNLAQNNVELEIEDGTTLGGEGKFLTPDANIKSQWQINQKKSETTDKIDDPLAESKPTRPIANNATAPPPNTNSDAGETRNVQPMPEPTSPATGGIKKNTPTSNEVQYRQYIDFKITDNPITIAEQKFFDAGDKLGLVPQRGALVSDDLTIIKDTAIPDLQHNIVKDTLNQGAGGFVGRNMAATGDVGNNLARAGLVTNIINPIAEDPIAAPPPRQILGEISEAQFFPINNPFVREDILPVPQKILSIISTPNITAYDRKEDLQANGLNIITTADQRITLGGGLSLYNRLNDSFVGSYGEAIFGDYGISFVANSDPLVEPQIIRSVPIYRAPLNLDIQTANFSADMINIRISAQPTGSVVILKNGNSFIDIAGLVYSMNEYSFTLPKELVKNIYIDNIMPGQSTNNIKISASADGVTASPVTIGLTYKSLVEGDDFITGGNFGEYIFGEGGNDKIIGGTGNDKIYGGTGNDKISDNGGADIINAGEGDDAVELNQDNIIDIIKLGDGNDILSLNLSRPTDFQLDMVDFGNGTDKLIVNYDVNFLEQGLVKNGLSLYSILQLQDYIYNQNRGFGLNQDLSGNYIFPGLGIKFNPNNLEKIVLNGPLVMLGSYTDVLKGKLHTQVPYNVAQIFQSFNDQQPINAAKYVVDYPQGLDLSFTNGSQAKNDYKFTITNDQLDNNILDFTTDSNNFIAGNFKLTITAFGADNQVLATRLQAIYPIAYAPPTFSMGETISGLEDTDIQMFFQVQNQAGFSVDNLRIYGFPEGIAPKDAAFIKNDDGSYQIDGSFLRNSDANRITLGNKPHSDDDYQLTFILNSKDNFGNQLASVKTTKIIMNPVADDVYVTLTSGRISEDVPITISIAYNLIDIDGSETFKVIVRTPVDVLLSAPNLINYGSYIEYTLNNNDLKTLSITPPQNSSESFSLIFTYITSELRDPNQKFMRSVLRNYAVTPVADTVSFAFSANLQTREDTIVQLSFRANLFDIDGSETYYYIISGLPSDVQMDRGSYFAGAWTLSTRDVHIIRTNVTPPRDYSGTLKYVVSAVSRELSNNNIAIITRNLAIVVTPVIDTPVLNRDPIINPNYNIQQFAGGFYVRNDEDTPNSLRLPLNFKTSDADGSETIDTIILSNLPVGVKIITESKITQILNPSEVVVITAGDIATAEILPTPHSSGFFVFKATAVAHEKGQTITALVTTEFKIDVTPIADGLIIDPNYSKYPVGDEDGVLNLSLQVQFIDTDGSEEIIGVVFRGVDGNPLPNGTTINYRGERRVIDNFSSFAEFTIPSGLFRANSSFLNLSGIQLQPPPNYDGNFALMVLINTIDGTSVKATSATFNLTIQPVADSPAFLVNAGSAIEDTPIQILINSNSIEDVNNKNLANLYPSESISYYIKGFDRGATFNKGILNAEGWWVLSYNQISELFFTPSRNNADNIDPVYRLTVQARSVELNNPLKVAISQQIIPIIIRPVNDTPSVILATFLSTKEDTPVNLQFFANVTDSSESITQVVFRIIPSSGRIITGPGKPLSSGLISNALNYWIDNPTNSGFDYTDLQFVPARDDSNNVYTIRASVVSHDLGQDHLITVRDTIIRTIAPVADPPSVNITANTGFEDSRIYFSINPLVTDIDRSEFINKIVIGGIPTGSILHNHDDDQTKVGIFANGYYTIDKTDIDKLYFYPRIHSSENITLKITAFATENSDSTSFNSTLETKVINILGVADSFGLTSSDLHFYEDKAQAFVVDIALRDSDGSEQIDNIIITGLPTAAYFTQGICYTDGGWKMTGGEYRAGVRFIPPPHSAGNFNLFISVATSEVNNLSSTQIQKIIVNYVIDPVADTPRFQANVTRASEDETIQFNMAISLVDLGERFERLILSGIPSGYIVSDTRVLNGINMLPNALGQVTLLSVDTDTINNLGLRLNPLKTERANWSGTFNLLVTAITSDGNFAANPYYKAAISRNVVVVVDPVIDPLSVGINNLNLSEDTRARIPLTISFNDRDGSEYASKIFIRTVFSGATKPFSLSQLEINDQTEGPDGWQFLPSDFARLFIKPAPNSDDDITLQVSVISSEANDKYTTRVNIQDFVIKVNAVVDTPLPTDISVTGLTNIIEDGTNKINFLVHLTDNDGSEEVSWIIRRIPFGASISGPNVSLGPTGYTFGPIDNSNINISSYGFLKLPTNYAGIFNMELTTIVREKNNFSEYVKTEIRTINVTAVADAPHIIFGPQTTLESQKFSLSFMISLIDTDNSETIYFVLNELESRITPIELGTQLLSGRKLTVEQLQNLYITPIEGYVADDPISLHFTIVSQELSNNVTAQQFYDVLVPVFPVADTAELIYGFGESTQFERGVEDNSIILRNFEIHGQSGKDANESYVVIIKGVPTGVRLSNYNSGIPQQYSLIASGQFFGQNYGEPIWVVAGVDQLTDMVVIPNPHSSDTISLVISVISVINSNKLAPTSILEKLIVLNVSPVVDNNVNVSFVPIHTSEDIAKGFSITISLIDTDGSETISFIQIIDRTGVVKLNRGTYDAAQQAFNLTIDQLSGLMMTPLSNIAQNSNLRVFIGVQERDGQSSVLTFVVPWAIDPVVDIPSFVIVQSLFGTEDTLIPFAIDVKSSDSSERIKQINVSGLPTGVRLSAGISSLVNGTFEYTLNPFQIGNLNIINRANYADPFTLKITAIMLDNPDSNIISRAFVTNLPVYVFEQIDGVNIDVSMIDLISGLSGLSQIKYELIDDDSETFKVIINPPDLTLPQNAQFKDVKFRIGGALFSWKEATFQIRNLSTLAIVPAFDTSDDFKITYTIVSSGVRDTNITKITEFVQNINVVPFVSTPSLVVDNRRSVTTTSENDPVAVPVFVKSGQPDVETLRLIIGNIPTGASFNRGKQGEISNTWVISMDDYQAKLNVTTWTEAHDQFAADLLGLLYTPPTTSVNSVQLLFTLISEEINAPGHPNMVSTPYQINIKAIIVTPQIGNVASIQILEDFESRLPFEISLFDNADNTISSIYATIPINKLGQNTGQFYYLDENDNRVNINYNLASKLTFNQFQLERLYFRPDTNSDDDLNLTFTITVRELAQSTPLAPFEKAFIISVPIQVVPQVDVPSLDVPAETVGTEDNFTNFSINFTVNDKDGSETISKIIIGGALSGTQFVRSGSPAGTFQDGFWTFASNEMKNLQIKTPPNFNRINILSVTLVAQEIDEATRGTANQQLIPAEAVAVQLFALNILPVADTPTFTTYTPISVTTNNVISLTIAAHLQNLGSFTAGARQMETLRVIVSGYPTGTIFGMGSPLNASSWQFQINEFSGIKVTPTHNFAGIRTLTFTAISTELENPTSVASAIVTQLMTVDPILITPSATTYTYYTSEDVKINLNLPIGLADDNEFASVRIIIKGLPSDGRLNLGTSASVSNILSWTVFRDQLSGLFFTPPANIDAAYKLTITAQSFAINSSTIPSRVRTTNITVNVAPVADTPTLAIGPSVGKYLLPISLRANLLDNDGSESLYIIFPILPSNMRYNFSGATNPTVEYGQLTNPAIVVDIIPADRNYELTVTAMSIDKGGISQTTLQPLRFQIIDQAITPILKIYPITENEDTAVQIGIDFQVKNIQDYNTTNIRLTTVTPKGSDLSFPEAPGSFVATSTILGNGDIQWNIEMFRPIYNGVFVYFPPKNTSGNTTLSFVGFATDGGTEVSLLVAQTVTIRPIYDGPTLGTQEYNLFENAVARLTLGISLTDDDGSESIVRVVINNVNPNISFVGISAGTDTNNNGQKRYLLTKDQANNLQVETNSFFDGPVSLQITVVAANISLADGGINNLSVSGNLITTLYTQILNILGVADEPIAIINDQFIDEDISVDLGIFISSVDYYVSSSGKLTESIAVFITQSPSTPTGTLNRGFYNQGEGKWYLTTNQLSGLVFIPQSQNNGSVILTISAIVSESNNPNSLFHFTQSLLITINAVADTIQIIAGEFSGREDEIVNMPITFSFPDTDESEISEFIISNVNGFLGKYDANGIFQEYSGRDVFGNYTLLAGQIAMMQYKPTQYLGGTQTLVITAISTEQSNFAQTLVSQNLIVNLTPFANFGSLIALTQYDGEEEKMMDFNLDYRITDSDGSESAQLVILGVPSGKFFDTNDLSTPIGSRVGSMWIFAEDQIGRLTFSPDKNVAGEYILDTRLVTSEKNGTAQTSTQFNTLKLNLYGVADTPSLGMRVLSSSLTEGGTGLLNINIQAKATSETIYVIIDNIPQGVSFAAGYSNFDDGRWTLNSAEAKNLNVLTDKNFSGFFSLKISAISQERLGNSTALLVSYIALNFQGVADTPLLNAGNVNAEEDAVYTWEIKAGLVDYSESLSVVISNIPTGFRFNLGTSLSETEWTIDLSNVDPELMTLKLTPTAHSDILTRQLSITIISKDNFGASVANRSQIVNFKVAPVSDTPIFTELKTATTEEDKAVRLSLGVALVDGDESLLLIINNYGEFAHTINNMTLSAWTFTAAQVKAGLYFTPFANSNGDFDLELTLRSSENNPNPGNITTTEIFRTLRVSVNPIADPPSFVGTPTTSFISANHFINLGLHISTINNQELPDYVIFRAVKTNGNDDINNMVLVIPDGSTLTADLGTDFIKINLNDNVNNFESLRLTYTQPHTVSLLITAVVYENSHLNVASQVFSTSLNFTSPLAVLQAPPILIDLDGDGQVSIQSLDESTAMLDVNGDGLADKIAWVDKNDGFVVADINQDGKIEGANEILIAQNTAGADTDLQALGTLYDENKDGVINKNDSKFNDLKIFQDLNGNGQIDAGEIQSLADWGINEISVNSDNKIQYLADGSTIYGTSSAMRDDGTRAVILDAGLAYIPTSRSDLKILPQAMDNMVLCPIDERQLPQLNPGQQNYIRIRVKDPHLIQLSKMNDDGSVDILPFDEKGEAIINETDFNDITLRHQPGKPIDFMMENITTKLPTIAKIYNDQDGITRALCAINAENIHNGDYVVLDIDGRALFAEYKANDTIGDIYNQLHQLAQSQQLGAIDQQGQFTSHGQYNEILFGVISAKDMQADEVYWHYNGQEFTPPDYDIATINAQYEELPDHYSQMDNSKHSLTPIWEEQGDYSLEFTGYFDLPITKNSILNDEYMLELEARGRDFYQYETNYSQIDPMTGAINPHYITATIDPDFKQLADDDSVTIFHKGDGENTIDLMQGEHEKIQLNGYNWSDLKVEMIGEDAHISFNNSDDKILLQNVNKTLAGDKSLTLDDILGKHIEVMKDEGVSKISNKKPDLRQDNRLLDEGLSDDDLHLLHKHEETHT